MDDSLKQARGDPSLILYPTVQRRFVEESRACKLTVFLSWEYFFIFSVFMCFLLQITKLIVEKNECT